MRRYVIVGYGISMSSSNVEALPYPEYSPMGAPALESPANVQFGTMAYDSSNMQVGHLSTFPKLMLILFG